MPGYLTMNRDISYMQPCIHEIIGEGNPDICLHILGVTLSMPRKYRFLELEHGVRSGSFHDAARSLPRKLYSGLSVESGVRARLSVSMASGIAKETTTLAKINIPPNRDQLFIVADYDTTTMGGETVLSPSPSVRFRYTLLIPKIFTIPLVHRSRPR